MGEVLWGCELVDFNIIKFTMNLFFFNLMVDSVNLMPIIMGRQRQL